MIEDSAGNLQLFWLSLSAMDAKNLKDCWRVLLTVSIFIAKRFSLSIDLLDAFTRSLFAIFTSLIYIAEALSAIIFQPIFYVPFASFLPSI